MQGQVRRNCIRGIYAQVSYGLDVALPGIYARVSLGLGLIGSCSHESGWLTAVRKRKRIKDQCW